MRRACTAFRAGCLLAALASPAAAGGAIGPCSPFHAADGDIASEMPGCGRRLRAAPGTLDDELAFRRRRDDAEDLPDDGPAPPRRRRR